MKRRTSPCPSCGAPVIFPIGAMVAVCDFCQSVVGRGDKELEDHGKVADLLETSTRLRRGLTGKFNKKEFTIQGRVQYRHPAGGVWDEWYLSFPAGRWGWLAEAQGKTYLMFEKQLKEGGKLPDFENMDVGTQIDLAGVKLEVMESGVAENAAAEGGIPWDFRNGGEHRFVDMQGTDGEFATLEYGESPKLFVGRSVDLNDLNLVGQGWEMEDEKISVSAKQLNCPKCGGQLTLRAPDQALRVTCPQCNSLLDVDGGKLAYFKTLKSKENFQVLIPLGTEGELFGTKYTVIGFLRRYATWQGKTFPWSEYLLYEPSKGFRWLVHNDRHWSFVEPTKSVSGKSGQSAKSLRYDGDTFRIYDRGQAIVRYVVGEFYWKVAVGDQARTADYIAPPRMLSFEWSGTKKSREVNITVGTYVPVEEIEKAFGVKELSRPWGVGVIQPFAGPGKQFYLMWVAFMVVLIGTQILFGKPGSRVGADGWLCFYGLLMVSAGPAAALAYRYSFEVKRWENSDYSPYATE